MPSATLRVMRIASIHIYPVKSLGGFSPSSWDMDEAGLRYDRRWMLVDESFRCITQRQYPQLACYSARLDAQRVCITGPGDHSFSFGVGAVSGRVAAEIWESQVDTGWVGPEADAFFSDVIGRPCRLVKYDGQSRRMVNAAYVPEGAATAFTDGYPLLVIGTASLADLNGRMEAEVPMDRFRPSIVVETDKPYDEDDWQVFDMGGVRFRGVKRCSRCVVTCIDQATGERSTEPLQTLSTYRKVGHSVYFGQHAISATGASGALAKGDWVSVLRRGAVRA